MEGLQQILPCNGVMNQDDSPRYIKSSDGEVIERINLRPNSIDGKRFENLKLKGNELIVEDRWSTHEFYLPAGNNKTLGWCRDYQNDAIIYFVYNSKGYHSILRYYQKEKDIEKIWYSLDDLDFEDADIRAFVAGKMLYWCNGSKPLKSFVIERAVNYTNPTAHIGDDTAYTADFIPFDEKVFSMIKKPPQFAPTVKYIDVGTYEGNAINFNNLRRKMFQFKYMYTYLDNQESAWSPISKVAIPPTEVSISGAWNDNIIKNNAIEIEYDTGDVYVKKITIAARECQDRTTIGDFYTFEEIEKYDKNEERNSLWDTTEIFDNIKLKVLFFNNKKLSNIDTDINNRYCDDTPLSGSDMILLDGKYSAVAMPVKNYDLVDVDYDLAAVETTRDMQYISVTMEQSKKDSMLPNRSYYKITIPYTTYINSDYRITINDGWGNIYTFTKHYALVYAGYPTQMAHDFVTMISSVVYANIAITATHTLNVINLEIREDILPDRYIITAEIHPYVTLGQSCYKNLKRGQYHPFVIIYNDGYGRYNVAQGNKELFSPYEVCTNPETYKSVSCQMSINNKPPDWAQTYRIGYLPNKSYTYCLQLPYVEVYKPETPDYDELPGNYYFITINQAIERMLEAFPNLNIPAYDFQEGDRIRKVCDSESYEILREYTYVTTGTTTLEITGYLISADIDVVFDPVTKIATIELLEIYRPNPGLDANNNTYNNIFYETGDEYEILDPGLDARRHSGDTDQVLDANADPLTPAVINLDFGDSYLRGRMGVAPAGDETAQIVEDMNFTDFFNSNGIDIGRVVAKVDSEQKELNSIVRSELFIEGSQINWLNVFLAGVVHFDASDIYGRITGIVEMGGTLKIIQEHKEGSIMIGQVTERQSDSEYIYIGDTVFGAYRRYEEDRGSVYRRSIAVNNRYVYYFDDATGEVIRSSPNGQLPISKDYNMQNWFEKKAKEMREYSGNKDVIIAFDNDYEEVIVSFIIGTTNETIVFSEKEGYKGWTHFVQFDSEYGVPENFATYKDNLISFLKGRLHLHGVGDNNTFYEKLHSCSLKVPANMYAAVMKRFSSIRMSTDKNIWNVEFNIDEGVNYPAQKSVLYPPVIRMKENALYASILRNIINRAGVEDFNLIHTGTRLVGEHMEITFSDDSEESVIFGVVQVNFLIAR